MAKKKLIQCKACGEEIAASAKTCPHCGAKNKKPFYKKAWFWILVVIVLIGALGGDAEEKAVNAPVEISTETVAVQVAEPVTSEVSADTTPVTEAAKLAFEPLTAVDNENCKVIITGIDPNNLWGYTINAEFENKSAEKTFMFAIDSCSVNGVQCETLTAKEVAPGKKAVEGISLVTNDLEKNGIKEFTDIEITFRIYNSNDWMEDPVAKETVNLYPFGKEKATTFIRTPQSSDTVLFANDNVAATILGTREDSIWGYTLDLYLENKTDKSVMFSVDEASVNGYMSDPFFASEVVPGKCKFVSISWGDSALEEIGITDYNAITNIEFLMRAYDSSNWMANDFANETIVFNP